MDSLDHVILLHSLPLLAQMPGVGVTGDWRQMPNQNVWLLRLRLELLNTAPTAELPQFTDWELVADFDRDPIGHVQLNPALAGEVVTATFDHQMFNGGNHPTWECRAGQICTGSWSGTLADSRNAIAHEPSNLLHRLQWHVSRAIDWLQEAATAKLMAVGDFFELPDFNTGPKGAQAFLAYYEDENSFAEWQTRPEQSGFAELVRWSNGIRLVRRFKDLTGRQTIYEIPWGYGVDAISKFQDTALWVRLKDVPTVRQRQVPTTWAELEEALQEQGLDLMTLVSPLWAPRHDPTGHIFVLFGMPIPRRVGELVSRYHWHLLWLSPEIKAGKAEIRRQTLKNRLKAELPVRWAVKVENWHPDELQNRGRLSSELCKSSIILIGAGALGSAIAEQLVRMGVQDLTIVDDELLEGGNLVRHTLTLPSILAHKVVELAKQLNLSNPLARVTGIAAKAPSHRQDFVAAAERATLVIDATADDAVLRSLPLPGLASTVPVASCSLSLYAEDLFFYANQAGAFDWSDFTTWFAPFRHEQNRRVEQDGLVMPRGAGCWHPLTPAPLNRIQGLAGIAVELVHGPLKSWTARG